MFLLIVAKINTLEMFLNGLRHSVRLSKRLRHEVNCVFNSLCKRLSTAMDRYGCQINSIINDCNNQLSFVVSNNYYYHYDRPRLSLCVVSVPGGGK
eukprot:82631-Pleurochrysis_carterae.AAC.1